MQKRAIFSGLLFCTVASLWTFADLTRTYTSLGLSALTPMFDVSSVFEKSDGEEEDELTFTNDSLISEWLGADSTESMDHKERGLLDIVFDFNEVSLVEDTPQNLIADGTADSASTAVASSTPVKLQAEGDAATLVMLLSYQRSGSSFIGGIFTDPENVFYVYEPLDPLYSAMYGTEDGWAVPSDIFSNKDGTLRTLPDDELQSTFWLLEKIYSCEMSTLPPAILGHIFWELFITTMSHTEGYVKCLQANGIKTKVMLGACQAHLKDTCGFRFGQKERQQRLCKSYLWGDSAINPDDFVPRCTKNRRVVEPGLPDPFQKYYSCLAKMDPILTKCAVEHFDKPCKAKSLRAIKTVRGKMVVAEHMLKTHENFYLLHLVRDPRGAVRSRSNAIWSQGVYSREDISKEAALYCSQTLDDVRRRSLLEQTGYASRIKELIYDGYAQEPLLNTLDVYHFLKVEASQKIKEKYVSNRKKPLNKQSSAISKQWEQQMSSEHIRNVNEYCESFFHEVEFDWPLLN